MSAFRRLRRKLAFAYAVSFVGAIVVVEMVIVAILGWHILRSDAFVEDLVSGAQPTAMRVAAIAAHEPVDHEALSRTIADAFSNGREFPEAPIQLSVEVGLTRSGTVTIVDATGKPRRAFACSRSGCTDTSAPAPTSDERERIDRALAGATAPSSIAFRRADGGVSLALALIHPDGAKGGAIWARLEPPVSPGSWARASAMFLATNGVAVALLGGIVGFGFGAIVARRLGRRLDRIGAAAQAWAAGNLDVVATSGDEDDELRDLAERLDAMASELRGVVALRGQLAAADERSRLARELHDGVKQQLFATAMLLGAARATAEHDVARTTTRIDEASGLLENAQRELVAVLGQLRPPSLDAPWPEGLRREVLAWSRRTGIRAELVIDDAPALRPATCDALMRIVQEALSNVARHGSATRVAVRLELGSRDERILRIEDDGLGIPENAPEGFGIISMRERASVLPSGTFRLKTADCGGACVEVTFREAG
jgi:signal transduction histidine kinase